MVRHTFFPVGSAVADPPKAAVDDLPADAGAGADSVPAAAALAAAADAAAVAAPAATASGGARS